MKEILEYTRLSNKKVSL